MVFNLLYSPDPHEGALSFNNITVFTCNLFSILDFVYPWIQVSKQIDMFCIIIRSLKINDTQCEGSELNIKCNSYKTNMNYVIVIKLPYLLLVCVFINTTCVVLPHR